MDNIEQSNPSQEPVQSRKRKPRRPKLPSHFNDREIIQICSSPDIKQFPLSKLVCIIASRDVNRLCLTDPDAVLRITGEQHIDDARIKLIRMLVVALTGVTFNDEQARKIESDGATFRSLALKLDSTSRKVLEAEPYDVDADANERSVAVNESVALFAQRAARKWVTQTTNPLDSLQFSLPVSSLQGIERSLCTNCGRSAALYCARCRVACRDVPLPPPIQLPVNLTIVHHDSDSTKKSTSVQACVLAQDVEFLEFRDGLPDFDPASTLLLFPSEKAISLDSPELISQLPNIRKLIIIESSWQKSYSVQDAPQLACLTHCKLPSDTESCYWRYQEVSSNALSSIEAIHAAMKAILQAQQSAGSNSQTSDQSRLDDLLYIFAHQHRQITSRYLDSTQFKRVPKAWSVTSSSDKSIK